MTDTRALRVGGLIDTYGDRHFDLCKERVEEALRVSSHVVIHGAGHNGRDMARRLNAAGYSVSAFSDDTPERIGTRVDGLPVFAPGHLVKELGSSVVAVVSIFVPRHDFSNTAARLRASGVSALSLFEVLWFLGGDALPFYFIDHPRRIVTARAALCRLAAQLLDETSVAELCRHLEFRLSLRHDVLPIWSDDRLFPTGTSPFLFIDGGAFDGDTFVPLVKRLGPRIAKGIAIEPDPMNYGRLQRNLQMHCSDRLGDLSALQAAVDGEQGFQNLDCTGTTGSTLSECGNTRVAAVTIDTLLANCSELPPMQLIKLDIEGAERRAIQGAAATIKAKAPMLAVAVYHKPEDLWEIAELLAELQPRYRFSLRSHGGDGADLMLYAIA